VALIRWVGGAIGLDVHRDFCVVAICEEGLSAPRAGCRARRRGWGCWRRVCWRAIGGVGGHGFVLGGRGMDCSIPLFPRMSSLST
jgi:hypothetical protein